MECLQVEANLHCEADSPARHLCMQFHQAIGPTPASWRHARRTHVDFCTRYYLKALMSMVL